MVQSYKKSHVLSNQYDCIIIGSGIGSLTTAALLSKEGKKVLVLEKHYTAGGFTHIFKRKGYEWDVGIHYIGEMAREKSLLKKLFDYITDGQLKWADMGDVYDKIIIGDQEFDFVKGVSNWKAQMKGYFPDESEVIDQYVDLIFEASKASRNFFMNKAINPIVSGIVGGFMNKEFHKHSDQTTYAVLRSLTDNELLIKVLCGQYGDFGLPPKQSSFYMHAAVVKHYFSGGYFPIGGSGKIVEYADQIIEKAGGTILISAGVKKILIEKSKAVGVEMLDGKQFKAEHIVSGAGIINSYKNLIPEADQKRFKLQEKLQKVKPSVAHGCLYIGLNASPEELDLPKHNLWIYPEDLNHDECVARYIDDISAPFPLVYVSFPSAKDPDWSNRYPGKSTIDIITLLPFDKFQKWEGTKWMKRGDDYDQLKEQLSQPLLDILYKYVPLAKGKVDHYELSTPLTTQHFMNYENGELYGLDHTPNRFRQKSLQPRTPIKNYFLTGQDIVTCGVGAAMFAGVLTVAAMGKPGVIKKIMG